MLELIQPLYQIDYCPKLHRIRCQGHILNLSTQAFLGFTNDEAIEGDTLTLKDLEAWKKYGALGKVHTFVVRRQRSPEQYQAFLQMSKGRAIPRDNSTRWNSMARMLKTVLEPQVRHAINRWFEERPADGKPDKVITEKDWETIEKVSY
jgi:hypothetical protein